MRHHVHTFLKWLPTLIPGAVLTMATVPLSDVGTTLSGNLRAFGINAPEVLKTVEANNLFAFGGGIALVGYVALLLWTGRKPKEKAFLAPIELNATRDDLPYRVGSSVDGIEWKKGYTCLRIRISNQTQCTFEDLSVVISPEKPIAAASTRAQFARPEIKILANVDSPALVYIAEDGSKSAEPPTHHEDNIFLGPPYLLVCERLIAGGVIEVTIATVTLTDDVMSSDMWPSEPSPPEFIDIHSSYKAEGHKMTDASRLTFEVVPQA